MSKKASFGIVILTLSMAQFIMTVDATIMNVSIPVLVEDLDTTVGLVQTAIALYALVMASLMLLGGKLGENYGRKKMFQIGLVIYAIGSAITAMAPSIGILIFGWSFLEGIGASLMMPAMMALISINFKGAKRTTALGITAGVAGAAAAVGPIIGGALSTYSTWRWAFVGEVIIALLALIMSRKLVDQTEPLREKLDVRGAVLAAGGLGLFVSGVLLASTYGWIMATIPFQIGDVEFSPFGLSIVPFVSGFGAFLIWRFLKYEEKVFNANKPFLLKTKLLDIIRLKSGLSVVMVTQIVLGGTLFIMPLFLQLVLGYSAMKSGMALLPISIALVVMSILSVKLTNKYSLISVLRTGQFMLITGLILLVLAIDNSTTQAQLILPFTLLGAAVGLIMPLIQTIVLDSVDPEDSSQVAGLNYTYLQLGMSLGTAAIGSVLLFSLGSGIVGGLSSAEGFDQNIISDNATNISANVEFVDNETLKEALAESDLTEEQQEDIVTINSESRLRALRAAVGVAAVIGLFGISSSGRIRDELARS